MRFHTHLLPTYFPESDPPFDVFLQQTLEQIQLAEELGFECFWFTEHHFVLYGGPVPNPAVIMSAAAARTSRIHLGSAISILPLHHPIQVAEDYAMVDVMSGGRLEFGVGLGNGPKDPEVFGIDREERRGRFEESIEVIKAAWTNERFSHHGTFWNMDDVALYPRPVRQPHPPFWAAATSPEAMQWAGRQGFNVMTVAHPFPPERARGAVPAWQAALTEAGHDPAAHDCKIHVRVFVDESSARAREVAETAITRYDARQREAGIGRLPPPPVYDFPGMLEQGRNVYGNPDECIKFMQATQRNYDFNIFSATFNFGGIPHQDVVRAMRLFAKEVMPAFQDEKPAVTADGRR
jgi:alkanesulfonate monooxygenase SsuD/methylene tetrahydromethanopterin reductase-like flavin-dependent oxidoreductase (luciferase family)